MGVISSKVQKPRSFIGLSMTHRCAPPRKDHRSWVANLEVDF